MTDYDNTNRGVLFNNTDRTSDKQPDCRGNLNVGGVEFWLSGWRKVSKNGLHYLSLSIQPKNSDSAQPKKSRADDLNDQIPF